MKKREKKPQQLTYSPKGTERRGLEVQKGEKVKQARKITF